MYENIISLSKHLGVSRKILESHGVLDLDLGIDTKLFVDPILIRDTKILEFKSAREKTLKYFNRTIEISLSSHLSPELKNTAISRIAVKEPKGCSLGYGGKSDNGTAISKSVANKIIQKVLILIQVGIHDPSLIEFLSMFVPKYGADSISDLTIHILYDNFCKYTHRITKELNLISQEFTINNQKFNLPVHPFKKEDPIIFIPLSFVSMLPIATDWESIKSSALKNATLRKSMELDLIPEIMENILKKQI